MAEHADWLDIASDLAERERAAMLERHAERRRREAVLAAARTGADCEDCGAEIGAGRLAAVPHATRCVSCETVAAKRGSARA